MKARKSPTDDEEASREVTGQACDAGDVERGLPSPSDSDKANDDHGQIFRRAATDPQIADALVKVGSCQNYEVSV